MAKKTETEMIKPQSLRLLMVEDSEDDELLIIRALKKGGYNPVYERVETAAAMRKALQDKSWDIILCDYKLPKFNAPSAIAVLKETNIDIPLVVVSGAIGEETAVECMRSGAHDYVMKGNLSRLCSVIDRESKESEIRVQGKRAEEDLKKSEKKYRLLANNVNDVIFVLDMNLNYTYISPSVKTLRGYEPEEVLKLSTIKTLTPSSWKVALKALSEIMELEKTGHREILMSRTLQLEMVRKDGTTVWTEVKFSFIRDENQQTAGIMGVTRDISERKQAEKERQQNLEKLRKSLAATVQSISMIVEMKDPYTSGHQERVSDLARSIATEMGLSADRQDFISTASSIHDIGKISLPTEILSKPTKLSELECSLIKTHTQSGYDVLKDIEFPWPVADVVLQHHERMNGSGYPQGLKGDKILLEARILAIADVVEAMASHRPYRPSMGIDLALEEISGNKGRLYDADAVDACLKLFKEKGYKLLK